MNERPLVLAMEDAKNMLINTVLTINEQIGLPASILDGIVSGILADLRKEACSEISMAAARERQDLQKQIEASKDDKEKPQ